MALFGKKETPVEPVAVADPEPVKEVVEAPKAAPAPVKLNTVIGKNTVFTGDITADEDVTIEGKVFGDVTVAGTLKISDTGVYEGNAGVNALNLEGSAKGIVVCQESARISATGILNGALNTPNLVTEEGCNFDGQLKIASTKTEAPAASATPDYSSLAQEGDVAVTAEDLFS